MRALPAAIAVIALLVSGCGGDPPVSVPTASGPATSAATPPPSDVPGRYGDAASTVREDSVYPDVGEPTRRPALRARSPVGAGAAAARRHGRYPVPGDGDWRPHQARPGAPAAAV